MIYPEVERRVRLSFTVFGKEVILIATVETIPQLVSYANKFSADLEAQREGALRESKAFRISASPKPDNPLSDVANAMFQSARSKFKEAEDVLTYIIRQQMSLHLGRLSSHHARSRVLAFTPGWTEWSNRKVPHRSACLV